MTIKILFSEDKNKNINFINISGHSNYGEYGNDIVCSAVSAITNGLVNFLILEKFILLKIGEINYLENALTIKQTIFIKKKFQNYIKLCLFQLKNIANTDIYNDNIKISKL